MGSGVNFTTPRPNEPRCHCVEGYYQCGFCSGLERQRIWNRMSPEKRAYDRYVDPHNSRVLDACMGVNLNEYERGCSCHISPPCSYCVEKDWDADGKAQPPIGKDGA